MTNPKYIAVTHCKNEEETIARCVESVIDQTVSPTVYVVVDDGSTDETPRILESYKERIKVIRREPGSQRARGNHHRNLLMLSSSEGEKLLPGWELLLTVDADEVLSRDYMEALFKELGRDPRLGITSGIPISKVDGGYRKIYTASRNVWNGARVYRRGCWEDINPIPSILGWDLWVQIEANRHGWGSRPFDHAKFLEERPWGEQGLSDWVRKGFSKKLLGYATIAHLITCLTRITHKPIFIGALAYLLSYLLYRPGKQGFFPDEYYEYAKAHTLRLAHQWLSVKRILKKLSLESR